MVSVCKQKVDTKIVKYVITRLFFFFGFHKKKNVYGAKIVRERDRERRREGEIGCAKKIVRCSLSLSFL